VTTGAFGQSDAGTIDHVRVLVHDMGACQEVYRTTLGFELSHAEAVVYQEGSTHNTARLVDGTYVELVAIPDREKLLNARPFLFSSPTDDERFPSSFCLPHGEYESMPSAAHIRAVPNLGTRV
jgi:catechol 2,3-dioxygenase-like lactoylglutathione lyase family enzyme